MAAQPDLCPACNAFVRIDWTTHCGACGAVLVQETQSSNATWVPGTASEIQEPMVSKGRGITTILFAVVVAVVVVGGTLMVMGKDKTKTGSAAFSVSTTSTTNPDAFADTLFLEPSAFNPKWTPLARDHASAKALTDLSGSCFPSDGLMANTAMAAQDYSYNLQSNNLEGGHLLYVVRISNTAEIADHQHQRVNSQEFEKCATDNAKQTMLATAGEHAVAMDPKLQRVLRNNIPVAYVDYRVSAKVFSPLYGSINNNVTDEVIYMQHGNARLRVEFFDCGCKLGPPPDKDAIINAAAAQLAIAPA